MLLYGALDQKGRDDTRISIYLESVMVQHENTMKAKKLYLGGRFDHWISEHYYLFGGEIPWSINLPPREPKVRVGNKEITVIYPFDRFTWESYHSKCNDIGNVPFVNKKLALECNLNFDVPNMSYHTSTGQLATKLLWDDYSKFLFIRKDILEQFLKRHGLTLLWIEQSQNYGDFGTYKSDLKPSYKNFFYVEIMGDK